MKINSKLIIPLLLALAFLLDGIFYEPPSPVSGKRRFAYDFNLFDWNVYVASGDLIEYSEEFSPSHSLTPYIYLSLHLPPKTTIF